MAGKVIDISELPVEVEAYEDENGYAIVITSEDARIGDARGKLVKNFLVRIARGDVPKVDGIHSVRVDDDQVRNVPVADARMDETGRLFVKSAADGVHRPAVTE